MFLSITIGVPVSGNKHFSKQEYIQYLNQPKELKPTHCHQKKTGK